MQNVSPSCKKTYSSLDDYEEYEGEQVVERIVSIGVNT